MTTPPPALPDPWPHTTQVRSAFTCQRLYKGCLHTLDTNTPITPAMPQQQLTTVARTIGYYDNWIGICTNCLNIDNLMNSDTNPVDNLILSVLNVAETIANNLLTQLHDYATQYLPGPTAYVTQAIALIKQLTTGGS